jgi:hypothetical protein
MREGGKEGNGDCGWAMRGMATEVRMLRIYTAWKGSIGGNMDRGMK